MDYIEIAFNISPKSPWTEIITQELAEIGFDSFIEEDDLFKAYASEDQFNENNFKKLIEKYQSNEVEIKYKKEVIPSQNWNASWESDYDPVYVDKKLLIKAPFHHIEQEDFEMVIEIQPQMSFGTGHHQTTYLLSKHLFDIDFKGKEVLDVGTGTGVLGILASKQGASMVFGTDIESGAVENAEENCQRNQVENFKIIEGDIDKVPAHPYDIIIANINKNVLKAHMKSYSNLIKQGGVLFLSGFFETDVPELTTCAQEHGFKSIENYEKETWAVMQLLKSD